MYHPPQRLARELEPQIRTVPLVLENVGEIDARNAS
uniref:Uncharacterized protein n=1 Tax=Anguilla anguilla TaxID=7936 RepID=A0A0E9RNL5_ANGAN